MTCCEVKDLELIDYSRAFGLQRKAWETVQAGGCHQLFLCEHPSVLTLGRMFQEENILLPKYQIQEKQVQIVPTDRGGDITLHAPGQLIVYPILNLTYFKKDLKFYLQQLEATIIQTLQAFGIEGVGNTGERGVWVKNDKIASMGIATKKWITYHGIGLNVSTDLTLFDMIRPCGLNVQMTSMEKVLGKEIPMEDVKQAMVESFKQVFELEVKK